MQTRECPMCGAPDCGRRDCAAELDAPRGEHEGPYQYAERQGQAAAASGGSWRDNPYSPGSRAWFEFEGGLKGE